eukprot:g8198.t1
MALEQGQSLGLSPEMIARSVQSIRKNLQLQHQMTQLMEWRSEATVQKLRMELSACQALDARLRQGGNDCNVEKLEKAEVFDELQPLVEELQWSLEAQEQKLEELLTTERSERRAATSGHLVGGRALLKLRSVAAGGAVGAPETRAPVEGTRSWAMLTQRFEYDLLQRGHQASQLPGATVVSLAGLVSLTRPRTFTLQRGPRPARTPRGVRQPGDSGPRTPRVAVLIDGDHMGPPWFEAILEAASALGSVEASCFGAPHLALRWRKMLKYWQVTFRAVQREDTTGDDDPNDVAIMKAADAIASSAPETIIAIASTDTDFLDYHLQLKEQGVHSLALVPYASDEKRCEVADVPVLRFRPPQSPTPGFADAFEEYFGRPF